MQTQTRTKWLKLLVAVMVGIVTVGFLAFDGGRLIENPRELAARVERGGWRSATLFGILFVIGGSLGIPPAIFVVAAGLLWPFHIAVEVSFVAGMSAASLGFFLCRYVARDFCAAHIPTRLKQVSESLHTRGIRTVIVLRLLFYLFPPVNWMLGLSRIRFRDYLAGSMIGALPGTVVYVLLGGGGIPWLLSRSPATIAWIVAGVAALVLLWWAGRSMWPTGEQEPLEDYDADQIGPTARLPYEPWQDEESPVSLSRFAASVKVFLSLAFRSFWPPRPYSRPPSLRRILVMLVFLPLFGILQLVHWTALLLDEILFPAYHKVRPKGAVFVAGIPRSGTTFLHRVLARDTERFTTFTLWELLFAPAICERRLLLGAARVDRFLGRPVQRLLSWITRRLSKGLDSVHRISLHDAEEDFLLLSPLLACFILIVPFPFAPEIQRLAYFDERLSDDERKQIMSFYYTLVQRHLHVHGSEHVFLSKNVSFTPALESLIKTFPEARIVVCVRPPHEAVPSQISAMKESWQLFANRFTVDQFEDRWMDLMEHYYEHLGEVLPQIPPQRHLLFEMEELRTNVVECVQELYRHFGFAMSEGFGIKLEEEAMSASYYKSAHYYTLEQYGLDDESIDRRYSSAYSRLATYRGK